MISTLLTKMVATLPVELKLVTYVSAISGKLLFVLKTNQLCNMLVRWKFKVRQQLISTFNFGLTIKDWKMLEFCRNIYKHQSTTFHQWRTYKYLHNQTMLTINLEFVWDTIIRKTSILLFNITWQFKYLTVRNNISYNLNFTL